MMVVMSSAFIFTYQSWLLGFSNICILTLITQKSDVSEIIHTTAKKKKSVWFITIVVVML